MPDQQKLDFLLGQARGYRMSDTEREAQVRSFAYGNLAIEDPTVTRADIDRAANGTNPRDASKDATGAGAGREGA